MKRPQFIALMGAGGIAVLLWGANVIAQTKQNPSSKLNPMIKRTGFFWHDGKLLLRDARWYLLMDSPDDGKTENEVRAFPWLAFDQLASPQKTPGEIIPFPRYTAEKHQRDGHPYPVGSAGRWFGAICNSPEEYEEYSALMLTIHAQMGEDPPSQKPIFEGAGFYIVTAH